MSKSVAQASMSAVIAYRNLLAIAGRGDQETVHAAAEELRKAEKDLPEKVCRALHHERVEAHIKAWDDDA